MTSLEPGPAVNSSRVGKPGLGQGWQRPPALGSQALLWLQLECGCDHLGLPWAPETTPKALPQVF